MNYTYCTIEDINKIKIGQELKINARYSNLKRKDGSDFEFVARKDDVVVVQSKTETYLVVIFYEDLSTFRRDGEMSYGEFVVEPLHIQKFY